MTSKEAKVHIIDTINGDMNKAYFINEILPKIEKDLDRLEELEKENKLLKKDLKEYQAYIKKGVEEHYKDFMQDYDVLLEEYEELMKVNDKLKKDLEVLELLKKYIYYSVKSHRVRMREIRKSIYNFDYEDLKEWLENERNKNISECV